METHELLEKINFEVLSPAFGLLPAEMDSPMARTCLLAIGLQESGLKARYQILNSKAKGPARGLWQFEAGGGVRGVLNHPGVSAHARWICGVRGVAPLVTSVWRSLERDDILAACFARLLLYADPKPLPSNEDQGWDVYLNSWRPGKPHADRWPANWRAAVACMGTAL